MIKLDHQTMSRNPSLGFYQIGNRVFWDKATAFIEGTKLGVNLKDIHWNFNEDVFTKYNWQIEPPHDMRYYYHLRARQLREKYDYLILNLSGGSDSVTALYSFIQQGLHLDEVVVRHATSGTKKYLPNHKNYDPTNEFSEFEFAAKPVLNWLSNVSPKTKITVHDFSKDVLDDSLVWDENFIHWTGDYVTPGCIVRYNHATNIEQLREFDKGKKVGIIFGVDKPRVIYQHEDVNLIFMDRPVHIALPATVNSGFSNQTVELFFWSPELPELVAKQAHLIKKWFEHPLNQRLNYMLNFWWLSSSRNRTAYESCIKGIIYQDYDLNTFQCDKPTKSVFQEWDYWLLEHKESQGYKTYMRGLDYLYSNINPDFLTIASVKKFPGAEKTAKNWEYPVCCSKTYFLGKFQKNNN